MEQITSRRISRKPITARAIAISCALALAGCQSAELWTSSTGFGAPPPSPNPPPTFDAGGGGGLDSGVMDSGGGTMDSSFPPPMDASPPQDTGSGTMDATPPTDTGSGGPTSPLPDGFGLVSGLSISSVAAFQAVKIPIFNGGSPVGSRNAPIVAGRGTRFRVYVQPAGGWTPHEVTAQLTIMSGGGTDYYTGTASPSGASADNDASSLFEIDVPGDKIVEGAQVQVALMEMGGSGSGAAETSMFNLDASNSGGLDVVVVPVAYNADGSGRVPDVSTGAMNALRDHIMSVFSFGEVRIRVRETLQYSNGISALSGGSWSALLNTVLSLKSTDGARDEEYYLGIFNPADSFGSYCRTGCIAGLAPLNTRNAGSQRGGIALGWPEERHRWSQIHELGHSMGRPHAPCGGAAGPDPAYPNSTGDIGVIGFDFRNGQFFGSNAKDLMGYCDPNWVSDFTIIQVHNRAVSVTGGSAFATALYQPHHMVTVSPFQAPVWGRADEVPAVEGEEGVTMLRARDADGRPLGWVAAQELQLSDGVSRNILIPTLDGAARYEFPDGVELIVPDDVI